MNVPKLPRWARWLVLGTGGALVLAAAATDLGSVPEVPTKAETRPTAAHRAPLPAVGDAAPAPRLEFERLGTSAPATGDVVGNVFGATSWYVPPPPPPPAEPPPPPPPPSAPPLPFTYLGTYMNAAVPVLILSKGDRVYTVSPGDVLDGAYRVETVSGKFAEFTFLPLNIRQTLAVGGT